MRVWARKIPRVCLHSELNLYLLLLIETGSSVCCIYHRPKAYDESSSESSSSSEGEEGSGEGAGRRKAGKSVQRGRVKESSGQGKAEEESSESDGGAGNGSARSASPLESSVFSLMKRFRPPQKPRRHIHHHHSQDCDHVDKHPPTPNRYDHQGKPTAKGIGAKSSHAMQ